jgi:hypothetical protein
MGNRLSEQRNRRHEIEERIAHPYSSALAWLENTPRRLVTEARIRYVNVTRRPAQFSNGALVVKHRGVFALKLFY